MSLSKKVWQRFVQEGVLDQARLNQRITESWYRCRQAGVNPYDGEGRHILSKNHLMKRKEQQCTFLDIALPFVDQLYRNIKGSGSIILLIDPDGYVLTLKGDQKILQMARDIRFVEGVKWTEDEVGTNAIGTALHTGEPIAVSGTEHYAVASQSWTCSAAPIHDTQGNLLGILDISSPVYHNHPHTLAAVVSTSYAIEQQWALQELKQLERKQVQRSVTAIQFTPPRTAKSLTFQFDGEKGKSKTFQSLLDRVSQVARFDTDVYIYGETGTGKELIARAIHSNSRRKDHPFVALNCGAIPAELLESELFGYEGGAFTGARRGGHKGKFLQAHKGILFLDEVSELPMSMQVTLLRVLQEREVTPIGGTQPLKMDLRVISASNRDLSQLVKEGRFREDLFYRLYRFPLHLPPLRERKEDIPHLIRYYLRQQKWEVHFPADLIESLINYDWPGNVRELFNVLEQLRILSEEQVPEFEHLPPEVRDATGKGSTNSSYRETGEMLPLRDQIKRENLIRVLRQTNGNITQAAKLLNISRSTFYRLLKRYRL